MKLVLLLLFSYEAFCKRSRREEISIENMDDDTMENQESGIMDFDDESGGKSEPLAIHTMSLDGPTDVERFDDESSPEVESDSSCRRSKGCPWKMKCVRGQCRRDVKKKGGKSEAIAIQMSSDGPTDVERFDDESSPEVESDSSCRRSKDCPWKMKCVRGQCRRDVKKKQKARSSESCDGDDDCPDFHQCEYEKCVTDYDQDRDHDHPIACESHSECEGTKVCQHGKCALGYLPGVQCRKRCPRDGDLCMFGQCLSKNDAILHQELSNRMPSIESVIYRSIRNNLVRPLTDNVRSSIQQLILKNFMSFRPLGRRLRMLVKQTLSAMKKNGVLEMDSMTMMPNSRPGRGRPGRGRPGRGRPGKGRPGKGRPGKGRPGKGRPKKGRSGKRREKRRQNNMSQEFVTRRE